VGQLLYLKNVVTLNLFSDNCSGCGMCIQVCPQAVMALTNGKARIENRDACMECGACARNCPAEAITVEAGVGCVAAVINTALGRKNAACCCIIEKKDASCC